MGQEKIEQAQKETEYKQAKRENWEEGHSRGP